MMLPLMRMEFLAFSMQCWEIMKEPMTMTIQEIHKKSAPTLSQRTALMLFVNKPKKAASLYPDNKRKIFLINSDMQILTGLENMRFKEMAEHTLSSIQLVSIQFVQ